MFDAGEDIKTFDIQIPTDALEGATTMRLRLKWSGSDCGDPCGITSYGEVEDYTLLIGPPPDADVGVIDIVSPISGLDLTDDEVIEITIKNNGSETQGNFPVSYSIDGGAEVVETFTGSLLQGETANFSFAQTADLSGLEIMILKPVQI